MLFRNHEEYNHLERPFYRTGVVGYRFSKLGRMLLDRLTELSQDKLTYEQHQTMLNQISQSTIESTGCVKILPNDKNESLIAEDMKPYDWSKEDQSIQRHLKVVSS